MDSFNPGGGLTAAQVEALTAMVSGPIIFVTPTGDTTGAADHLAMTDAFAKVTARGSGAIEYAPGTYYSKFLTGGENRNIPSNTVMLCRQPNGAKFVRVGTAGNYSNQITLSGVSNVTIEGFWFEGNRSVVTGIPPFDNDGNGIRVVDAVNWTVRDCLLTNQPYHGLIGVRSCELFTIENVTGYGNGYRSLHVHSDDNRYGHRGIVRGIRSYRNGTHETVSWAGVATTTAASAVVQLSAGDGALWAGMFSTAGGAGTCFFIMPGAGTGGSTLIETVASVNSGANQITLTRNAPTSVVGGPAQGIGELTSGVFLTFGSDQLQYSDIQVWDEPAQGLALAGVADSLRNYVWAGVGSVHANNLSKLLLAAGDYSGFKAAYNALSAGNKALTLVNVDAALSNGSGLVSAISAFNDADASVSLSTAATSPITGAKIIVSYSVASAGNLLLPSTSQSISGATIDNCGFGLYLNNMQDTSFSGVKINNSAIHGIYQVSGSGIAFDSTCTVTNSGACPWYLQAVLDSTGNSFNGRINGAGAAVALLNSPNRRLTNTVFGPTAVVENCGQSAHFRQVSNFLGTVMGAGIVAANNNGNGLVEGPRIQGSEIARNWLGGIRLIAVGGAGIYNARVYDNVDPSAVSAGTASGKGARAVETIGACGRVEIIGNDFNCRDRVNDSYTLDVSTGTTTARVLFNRLELETRNAGGGNVAFGNASTVHYGNWLHASAAWSGGGVTAVPAV